MEGIVAHCVSLKDEIRERELSISEIMARQEQPSSSSHLGGHHFKSGIGSVHWKTLGREYQTLRGGQGVFVEEGEGLITS